MAAEQSQNERNYERTPWRKILLAVVSIFLFVLAIILMEHGASTLTPLIRDQFGVDQPVNALGFGWLFSYIVMSGSPAAGWGPASSCYSSGSCT